jgi:ribosomal protein S16
MADQDQTQPADAGQSKHQAYEIIVNGRGQKVDSDIVTFDQVVKLAPSLPPPGPNVEYKVVYKNAVDPRDGTLIEGESVQIKNGTQFVVSATNRS